jgi:hypothetical protein
MVAAKPTPAISGAARRVLTKAETKPANASTPTCASWLNPTIPTNPPAAKVRKPTMTTVPPMIASAPLPRLIDAMSLTTSTR